MKKITVFACLLLVFAVNAASAAVEVFNTTFSSDSEFKCSAGKGCSASLGKYSLRGRPVNYEMSDGGNVVLFKNLRLDAVPDRIVLKMTGDGSRNQAAIRLVDAAGETFRFPVGELTERELVFVCNPERSPRDSWGGKANKKIDLPIRAIAVELRNMARYWKCEPKGTVFLKQLAVYSNAAAMDQVKRADKGDFPVVCAVPRGKNPRFAEVRDRSGKSVGRFAASFDERYLYLTFRFADATPNYPHSGHGIYENDCVEIWIDARGDSLFGLNQEDDAQIVVTPKNTLGKPEFRVYRNPGNAYLMADGSLSAKTDASGWSAELKIPLDGLPGLRNEKRAIGFAVNQVDNRGKAITKAFWGGQEPLSFGFLTFGELSAEQLAGLKAERRLRIASLKASGGDPMKNTYRGEPRIYRVSELTEMPKRFERFELAVRLDAEYGNPFDFNDVNLYAEFVSPSGKTVRIDGFLYRKYELFLFGRDAETVRNPGEPEWRLRFAPTEEGAWKYRVLLKDRKGREAKAKTGAFTVGKSSSPGFLRVSPHDSRYLAFDDGSPFFGLGFASHSWNARNVVLYTKHYLNQLAAFGGNYTSINLECPGNGGFGLQTGTPLGVYSLANAFRLDYIIECAERRGVYLLPCLHQTKLAMLKHWSGSIYSKDKGGPCERPDEFFTSPEMRKLIKNRLRYMIARWGYSTNLLGFEIFNEVNYTDGFRNDPASVVEFHRDLASYLKEIDPNKHLVSTCFGSSDACELPEIWKLKELDFTVTHSYANDIAGELFNRQRTKACYGKPVIGGENGIPANFCGQAQSVDPSGISFHNNLWSSLVTKSAGNVLQWWYSHLHDPLDFYAAHYPQFKRFIADIAFDRENFQAEEPAAVRAAGKSSDSKMFPCVIGWPAKPYPEYMLAEDGIWWNDTSQKGNFFAADLDSRQRAAELPGLLTAKGEIGSSVKLSCSLPQKSVLRLRLSATGREGAVLNMTVNGKALPPQTVADKDGLNNPYAKELNTEVKIPLEAGANTIVLANRGRAFLSLESLRIDRFGNAGQAENVRVGALSGPRTKLIWIQNMQNTWYKVYCGEKVEDVRGVSLQLEDISGLWELNWYDPYQGDYLKTERLRFSGRTRVPVPVFRRDIALKMKKIGD